MTLPRRLMALAAAAAMAAAAATAAAAPLVTEPTDSRGRPLTYQPAGSAETPQNREFRAGLQALLAGDPAEAKARFEAVLKLDPQFAPALVGMASLAQTQGRPVEAEAYLKKAELAAPKAPEVHLGWGRYYMARRQFDAAEKSFIRARDLAPKAVAPLIELGDLYLSAPGRAADALRSYRAAVALDPGNSFAQYGLGAAASVSGQHDAAVAAFERAAELRPKDPAPLRAIGRLQLEAGAPVKALAAFDRGLARQPSFVPLMLDRSEALARLTRWNDAASQLQAAEELSPLAAEIQLQLGDVYQGAGRWAEAESRYLKTIELAPKNPIAYNNLAWMTVSRGGDAKKAVEWARTAVELSPRSSPFYDTLGWAERAAGNLAGATAAIGKAIELEPRVAAYHLHLGTVQADLKQTAAARASLQRAIDLDPSGAQADESRRLLRTLPPG